VSKALDNLERKKAARLKVWKDWIAEFMSLNEANPLPDYEPIANAEELLNLFYWRLVTVYLRPILDNPDNNINYYKIISASELTIMAVRPFKFKKRAKSGLAARLNAEFAWFVATSIIRNWKVDEQTIITDKSFAVIVSYKEKAGPGSYNISFRKEHILWLQHINPAAPLPVLLNSQLWRMVLIAAKAAGGNL
jgi:hypothetical protein